MSGEGADYGYYSETLHLCFLPPDVEFYYLNCRSDDVVGGKIKKNIDEMDIYE